MSKFENQQDSEQAKRDVCAVRQGTADLVALRINHLGISRASIFTDYVVIVPKSFSIFSVKRIISAHFNNSVSVDDITLLSRKIETALDRILVRDRDNLRPNLNLNDYNDPLNVGFPNEYIINNGEKTLLDTFPALNKYPQLPDDIKPNSSGVFHYQLYLNNFKQEAKKSRSKRYLDSDPKWDEVKQEAPKLLSKHIEFDFPTFNIHFIINSQNKIKKYAKTDLFNLLSSVYVGNGIYQGAPNAQRAGESNIGFNSAGFTSLANDSFNNSKKSINMSYSDSLDTQIGYPNQKLIIDLLLSKTEKFENPKSYLTQCPLLNIQLMTPARAAKGPKQSAKGLDIIPTTLKTKPHNGSYQSLLVAPIPAAASIEKVNTGQLKMSLKTSLKTIMGLKSLVSIAKANILAKQASIAEKEDNDGFEISQENSRETNQDEDNKSLDRETSNISNI